MKIFVYKNQIVSLENFAKICPISSTVLEVRYHNSERQTIYFDKAKDLTDGVAKIVEILREPNQEMSI